MVNEQIVHIIMPVKDSPQTTEDSIRAIIRSGATLRVYDDFSAPENAARLDQLRDETGIEVVHISKHTEHPSPNYRFVLIDAQRKCLQRGAHLIIVESDVVVQKNTLERLIGAVKPGVGIVAAVTTDEKGNINFPYEYARSYREDGVCRKRLSFCCTLLTNEFLQAYDFSQLDETKNWYDVTISHKSAKLGLENILQISNPVLHRPHSSRPWKQLKYTNPLLYYWRKFTQRRDKI